MKFLFKFTYSIFLICGFLVFGTMIAAGINELLLKAFGVVITINPKIVDLTFKVFPKLSFLMVLTSPLVFMHILVKEYAARTTVKEGQRTVILALCFLTLLVFIPVVYFLFTEGKERIGIIWATASIAGFIIANGGRNCKVPVFEK